MSTYNYQINSIPAVPRSKKRRERNISVSGSISSISGGDRSIDLADYVKWSDIVKESDTVVKDYLDNNIMSSLKVKTLLDTHDHANKLIRPAVLLIPRSAPDTEVYDIKNNEIALYFSNIGSYAESGGGGIAEVYKLYLQRNGVQIGVFDAGAQDATINIDVPTKVSELLNDAGYLTQHQSLADYYTKTEVDNLIPDMSAYLPKTYTRANYGTASIGWGANGQLTINGSQYTNLNSPLLIYAGARANFLQMYAMLNDTATYIGYLGYYSASFRLFNSQANKGLGVRDNGTPVFFTSATSYVELWHQGNLTNVSQLNNDASYVTSSALATTLADYALASSLPTNLTDLTNDLVPAWALASTKPTYNYSEIVDAPDVSSMISTALAGYSTTTEIGTMLSAYLPLSGGVMTGAITWGGNNTCLRFANTAGTIAFNLISLRNTTSASPYIDIGQWVAEADSANRSLIAMGGYQYNIYFGYRDNTDNYIQLASTGQLSRLRSITPLTTNTYNLGTVALTWANIYTQYLNLANGGSLRGYNTSGSVYVILSPNASNGLSVGNANWAHLSYQASTFMVFQVRESNVWRTPLRIEGSEMRTWAVRPATNNTYDIGTTTHQYVNAYIKNIIASDSVKTAVAEVSTNLAIPTTAPSNPDSSKVYLYFSDTGAYAE